MLRMALLLIMLLVFTLPAAAQEETPEAVPELTELFSSAEMLFTFHYPAGWQAELFNGQVFLSNTSTALDYSADYVFPSGEVRISIASVGSTARFAERMGLEFKADDSPVEILQAIIDKNYPSSYEAQAVVIGDMSAASLTLPGAGSDNLMWLIQVDSGDFIIFQLTAAPGELTQSLATAQAIAESIQYLVPALKLSETYTSDDGLISFQYPGAWVITTLDDTPDEILLMAKTASGEDVIARDPAQSEETFQPEEVWIEMVLIHALLPPGVGFNSNDDTLATSMYLSGLLAKPLQMHIGDKRVLYFLTPLANQAEKMTIMVEYDNNLYLTLWLITAPGQWVRWMPTAQAIIASVVYSGSVDPTPEATEELHW